MIDKLHHAVYKCSIALRMAQPGGKPGQRDWQNNSKNFRLVPECKPSPLPREIGGGGFFILPVDVLL